MTALAYRDPTADTAIRNLSRTPRLTRQEAIAALQELGEAIARCRDAYVGIRDPVIRRALVRRYADLNRQATRLSALAALPVQDSARTLDAEPRWVRIDGRNARLA